ncbi:MAG: hypothetical protein OXE85_12405, partial [Roseovarius sp.]|nr:hypothetical protein [Roseovarius sp.]
MQSTCCGREPFDGNPLPIKRRTRDGRDDGPTALQDGSAVAIQGGNRSDPPCGTLVAEGPASEMNREWRGDATGGA